MVSRSSHEDVSMDHTISFDISASDFGSVVIHNVGNPSMFAQDFLLLPLNIPCPESALHPPVLDSPGWLVTLPLAVPVRICRLVCLHEAIFSQMCLWLASHFSTFYSNKSFQKGHLYYYQQQYCI